MAVMERDIPYTNYGGAGMVSSKVNSKYTLPSMQRPKVKGSPILPVNGKRDVIYPTTNNTRRSTDVKGGGN